MWSVVAYFVIVAWGVMFTLAERIDTPSMWRLPKSNYKRWALASMVPPIFIAFSNHLDKVWIVVLVAIFLICFTYGLSDYLKKSTRNVAAFLLCFSLGSMVIGLAAWHAWPVIEEPSVDIAYSSGILPLHIATQSCDTILWVNRKLQDFPEPICNFGSQTMVYPSILPKDTHLRAQFIATSTKKGGTEMLNTDWLDVGTCTVTNHSDKDLIGAKMQFYISFQSSKSVEVYHRNNNDGTFSTTFNIEQAKDGGLIWTDYEPQKDKDTEKGWTYDKEISNQERTVVIRTIPAHKSVVIYVVSASHYPIRFDLPSRIFAVVSGESEEREIQLIRPRVGIFDAFPWWGLPPNKYTWPNIPNDE